eukprot:TRINITY_DN1594_c0_g2_i3.p1 TRINITY_DN1594_c0_g2~~TRINITY_DN1594_c0_g2_i3.p1  ORF type:complete len:528 (+),score=64.31 TRINITY_DN1594_c0_g2_i3:69-1652(+)
MMMHLRRTASIHRALLYTRRPTRLFCQSYSDEAGRSPRARVATAEGTSRFASRFDSSMPFQRVPKTSLSVSCITLGAALLPKSAADAKATLRSSIEGGINSIDLSATVLDGASQQLIGAELPALATELGIQRDELVLSSRLGVIPNQRALRYKSDPALQNMHLIEGGRRGYDISAEYLRAEISASVARLQTGLDIVLIQEPELLLQHFSHDQVFSKLLNAFSVLEEECKQGRIQGYGISSSFATPTAAASSSLRQNTLSLSSILTLAEKAAGGASRLMCVQYPINILETEAARKPSEPGNQTLQAIATKHGLMQLAIRPLKTMVHRNHLFSKSTTPAGQYVDPMMYRLVDTADEHAGKDIPTKVKEVINFTIALEKSYATMYDKFKAQYPELPSPQRLSWVSVLLNNIPRMDLETFKLFASAHVLPDLGAAVEIVNQNGPKELTQWAVKYQLGVKTTMERYEWLLEANRFQDIFELRRDLDRYAPELQDNKWTATKAIRSVLSGTGRPSAVVGFRSAPYAQFLLGLS